MLMIVYAVVFWRNKSRDFILRLHYSFRADPAKHITYEQNAGSIWQDLLRRTRNDQVPLCLQQGGYVALRGTELRAAVIGSPRGTQYRYLRFAHRHGEGVRGRRSNDPYIFNFITRRTWEINLITTRGVSRIFFLATMQRLLMGTVHLYPYGTWPLAIKCA